MQIKYRIFNARVMKWDHIDMVSQFCLVSTGREHQNYFL